MSIETTDLLFRFDNSCNFTCCFKSPMEGDDPIFINAKGQVRRFDFHRKSNALQNAKSTLLNLQSRIARLTRNTAQLENILKAVEKDLKINLATDVRVLHVSEVLSIEALTLKILRRRSIDAVNPLHAPRISKTLSLVLDRGKESDVRLVNDFDEKHLEGLGF